MSGFSVKKPYTVLVGVVLAIVLGFVSLTKMTADLLPNISLPYVIVMTTYPGASPETVEMVVTQPVESAMATVTNIESISSVSNENYSMVICEFAQSADMNAVSFEIRENIDQIKSYWDDSVGSPIIMKLNPNMLPVMIAAVGVDGMEQAQISTYVKDVVMPELESIDGVASASAVGMLEESVNVVITQDKIDKLNKKVFASIDEKMKEAYEELENGRKELEDGKNKLADGKRELLNGQQEMNNSEQGLADGRSELEEGRRQLEEKQNEITSQLAAQKAQLTEAKNKLEPIQENLSQAKLLDDGVKEIDKVLEQYKPLESCLKDYLLAMATVNLGQDEQAISQAKEQIRKIKKNVLENEVVQAAFDQSEELQQIASYDELKEMKWADPENVTTISTFLGIVQQTIVPAVTDEIKAKRSDLMDAINALTSGMGYEEYKKTVMAELEKQGITDLDAALKQIDEGLIALEKGEMTAAIEMANGKASLSIGELKLEQAESQLSAAREQIESGLKQLEESQKQLEEGEEKLAEGEQQLEEAKKEAYEKADMAEVVTVDMVKGLLAAQNFAMPAGYVTEEGVGYLVRVGDKPESVEELEEMPLLDMHLDGVPVVRLKDVADVFYTDNSDAIYTNVNGSGGVMLTIQKQTGYSTGDVSDKLEAKFKDMMEREQGLTMIPLMDQGIYIDLVMDSILNNILFGGLLSILILFMFLKDFRPTLVVAFAIPISLVTAIVLMYFSGVTLNVISLSGLALGIGMLVDNSIVVIENIYRMRSEGRSMMEASIEGAKEVSGAIVASTLTTVCVFLPIIFTEGITRQLFVDMGLTIGYSLFASLLIAITVVPAMASKVLTKTEEKKQGRLFEGIINFYAKSLEWCLKAKPVVFIAVILFLALSIVAAFSNGTAFMAEMDSTQLTISVELDKDATLAETAEVTNQVVDMLLAMEDVQDVGAMCATSTMSLLGGGGGSENATSIYVVTKEDKKHTNDELAGIILEQTADLPATISVETSTMDMSAMGGSGISIQVRGRDLDKLREIAISVSEMVAEVEGTTQIDNGVADSQEELRILVDREKAAGYGLTVAQVFTQINTKIAEAKTATTLVGVGKDYGVYVLSDNNEELTRELMKSVEIAGTDADGKKVKVPLKEIAEFKAAEAMQSIHRADQNRYVSVTAQIAEGYNVGQVGSKVQDKLKNFDLPEGYKLVFSGENETINEALSQVELMLILALVFMYLIMVAQFQSLLSPFIIMFTIPLAFTGGFFGLFVSGSEVSVIAMIGFVMLAGIIVNNGIVLIDYMNQLREAGVETREAIITAGRTRLRPVLMTALTTILALSTMVFSNDMGSEMGKPMAVVTIGGLLYGTLLTLVVIPCVYELFTRFGNKKKRSRMTMVEDLDLIEL